jgi:replication initiation and membrane attachment protein DnaB
MLHNTRFFVAKKYGFSSNHIFLYDLYSPIIGDKAINLFVNLTYESEKQAKMMNVATEMNDFLKQLGISIVEFAKTRTMLEAMGLLTSYLEIKDDISTYSFIINEPLNFKTFNENQKYRHLLIKNIGEINYQKLEYIYGANRISNQANNVTATFESVFNDAEISQISLMNFDELYKRIAACTSLPIVIGNEAKTIVESYFKNYDLSISEIEHVIYNSTMMTDEKDYRVDPDLLKIKFNQLINSVNNLSILGNIKLNRNAHMFMKHLDKPELTSVFMDYQTLNAEQYLRAITKTALTPEHAQTINMLRNKYFLPDYVINLLVDYTLFKTNGTLNNKYISKVAQTVNNLGFKSLEQIYDHFHFVGNINYHVNKTNAKVQETLVE